MRSPVIFILGLLLFALSNMKAQYSALNFTLVSLIDPEPTLSQDGQKYSGCWGWYQASKNKEYAIACSHKGTYWIDVTVPATPSVSAYRAGKLANCTWREAKSYRNYLYVISDDAGNNSFQIFDMKYLPDSVHKVYDSQNLFTRGHTLYVDGDKLYVGSVTKGSNFSSMNVYSLADPEKPVLLRELGLDYPAVVHVHDMYVRRDTIYASCGNQGLNVYQLTSANTFTQLGSLSVYPFSGYNHSSALTPNGRTLVFTDEVPSGLPIKVADVTNLANIQIQATINQFQQTTPHNPFMGNNQYCFVSSYQDGLQLLDISAPTAPVLAGYFDTHPQTGGNNNTWPTNSSYDGQWGAYPYLPSGTIFALDRLNGAFMLNTALFSAPLANPDFYMPQTICAGGTFTIVNTSTSANTFTWVIPGSATGTTLSPGTAIVSFSTPGIYSITLLAANASNSASATQTISVVNSINAVTGFTNSSCPACANGIASVTLSGGTAPYTISWTPSGGVALSSENLPPGCYTVTITDAEGCSTTTSTCISYDQDVGLSTVSPASGYRIYPNPAHDLLYIESAGIFDYAIYNLTGQLTEYRRNNHGKAELPLNTYAKGIYIICIENNNNQIHQKLIIE